MCAFPAMSASRKHYWAAARIWIQFGDTNRRRGASDIAVAVYEEGSWRHCDYLTLQQAREYIAANPQIALPQRDLQTEYDFAKITFSSEHTRRIVGSWRGWYICGQGKTGLVLDIRRLPDGGLAGRFNFFPVRENPNIPQGAFEVRVLVGHTHTFIEPTRWLERPNGYQMVSMFGLMNETGTSYQGKIQLNTCSDFTLSKNN